MREKGKRIYIEDLGKGYQRIEYIGELNVEEIKIEKDLKRNVGND